MRKAKEDAMITREDIMDAAFRCFFDNGFATASLEMIAKDANVTRGAVYWHFKDKKELYREVVNATLKDADVVNYAYNLPDTMDYEERMYEIFWFAQSDNPKVDFIYKALNVVSIYDDFRDIQESIQLEKIKLYRYFVEETRIHIRENAIEALDAEVYASDLFLLFEGMFLTKNLSVGIERNRDNIKEYVKIIIKDLI